MYSKNKMLPQAFNVSLETWKKTKSEFGLCALGVVKAYITPKKSFFFTTELGRLLLSM